MAKNSKLWEGIAVRDLTAKDFRLFEEGQEQTVQSVRLELPSFRIVQDNLGKHPVIVGSGGGLWDYPDYPMTDLNVWLAWPQYVIAYVPPASTPGSCHQIQVKVGRPNLVVWAGSEYCNTKHSASDPLNGTEFGRQLEAALSSPKEGKINLALQVASFYNDPGTARVYITLQYPWKSLKHEFKDGTLYATIGALVMVYNKDGTLAARYSDFACCDYGNQKDPSSNAQASEARSNEDSSLLPSRYENQFDLPPGEYDIRVALSDGENFGFQQTPLTVDNYVGKQLALSDVALSRRVRNLSPDSPEVPTQPPDNYRPLVSKGIDFTPTAETRFHKAETLYAYFEVYDPLLPGPAGTTVQAHLRIVNADTREVLTDFQAVNASP